MGYTHSWYRPTVISEPVWGMIRRDVAGLVTASPVKLVRGDGDGSNPPDISEGLIMFNGAGGDGYEVFRVPGLVIPRPGERVKEDGLWFGFCKTGRRGYDVVVAASLIVLKHHLGDNIKVYSDGLDEDWKRGFVAESSSLGAKAFCQQTLGYGSDYEIVSGTGLLAKSSASPNNVLI